MKSSLQRNYLSSFSQVLPIKPTEFSCPYFACFADFAGLEKGEE
jgi:hypothetical protein